jgi:diacylglycerol kinase family enzyme
VSTQAHEREQQAERAAAGAFRFAAPDSKRRMLLIVNPYATTVDDRLRSLVVSALQSRFEVEAIDTVAAGHAIEICRRAGSEGYDVVVAFGGDGTVNEAANGLLGSPTPLCCLPGGSANVFGKMLGIPGDVVDATQHLLRMADHWHPRRVDLGVVNGRCFTFASGVGLDASVVERVDANPAMKRRLGPWFFTWVAVTTFMRRYLAARPPRLELEVAGRQLAGVTAIIQNGAPFTYFRSRPINIADGAALDSGALAGGVLHSASLLTMPGIAWRAFSPRARVAAHRRVTGIGELSEFTVRTADGRGLPLQVDGDYVGEVSEARYSILPDALNIVA